MQRSSLALEKSGSIWEGAALVAGTAIGGGMLAIPLFTCQGGFYQAVLASLAAWACLTATGLAFCRVLAVSGEGLSFLALTRRWLAGTWTPLVASLFMGLVWLLLVAYCAGGGALLQWPEAPGALPSLLFALPLLAILGRGRAATARWNSWMFSGLIASGIAFAILAAPQWETSRLLESSAAPLVEWWMALPVLFAAFGFHNVLPTVRMQLGADPRKLSMAVLLGTTVALLLIVGWQALVFGCCSIEELRLLAQAGQPVGCAMAPKTWWAAGFQLTSLLFAYLAMATSFLGVAQAGAEVVGQGRSKGTAAGLLIAFVGSAWLAGVWIPGLFGKALAAAGGLGVSFLNGVIPVAMLLGAERAGAVTLVRAERAAWRALMALCLIPLLLELW